MNNKNEKILKIFTKILIVILIIFFLLALLIYNLFFHATNLPEGDFLDEFISPNGEYTVKSYWWSGGATLAGFTRCEVINNNTRKSRNIYWEYRVDYADVTWKSNERVIINGISLNVLKDSYNITSFGRIILNLALFFIIVILLPLGLIIWRRHKK